jgi:plastocyanin
MIRFRSPIVLSSTSTPPSQQSFLGPLVRLRSPIACLPLLIGAVLLLGASGATAFQGTDVHTVGQTYQPDTLAVAAGTAVHFFNDDTDIHTITARDGSFDSGLMFQGQNWTYVFNNPGTYDYYCLPHPWMLGKIVVQ